jgi:hypothetical protein
VIRRVRSLSASQYGLHGHVNVQVRSPGSIFASNQLLVALERRLGEAAASRVKAMCWPHVLEVRGADLRASG